MKEKKLSEVEKFRKRNSLTWSYFWQAKFKEFLWLMIILVCLVVVTLLPLQLGEYMINNEIVFNENFCNWAQEEYTPCDESDYWFVGFFTLFVLGLISLVPYWIIKWNWEYAKDKSWDDVYGN